jgi:menaquinone-dependent protoporphyrinogen oxidase
MEVMVERSMLIAYASRHGSTAGIAQRMAAMLNANGVDAIAQPVSDIKDFQGYDGYVVGSAVYSTHWLAEASAFVRDHCTELRRHPVWLFSSGPLSSDPKDRKQAVSPDVRNVASSIHARRHRVFGGVWRRGTQPIGAVETLISHLPDAGYPLPEGDFRDWSSIDQYARTIAGELDVAVRSE